MYKAIGKNIEKQTVYECDKCKQRTTDPATLCSCNTAAKPQEETKGDFLTKRFNTVI